MEGDQGAGSPPPEPPRADGAALPDSFTQLWSDVMGMLVSDPRGGGPPGSLTQLAHKRQFEVFSFK